MYHILCRNISKIIYWFLRFIEQLLICCRASSLKLGIFKLVCRSIFTSVQLRYSILMAWNFFMPDGIYFFYQTIILTIIVSFSKNGLKFLYVCMPDEIYSFYQTIILTRPLLWHSPKMVGNFCMPDEIYSFYMTIILTRQLLCHCPKMQRCMYL